MGANSSRSREIAEKLQEFEAKTGVTNVCVNGHLVMLDQILNGVGDYYTTNISNDKYFYYEGRFKQLVANELSSHPPRSVWTSKREFIVWILQDNEFRQKLIEIVKRKGFLHQYRWAAWYALSSSGGNSFTPDSTVLQRRVDLYREWCREPFAYDAGLLRNGGKGGWSASDALFSSPVALGYQIEEEVLRALARFLPSCQQDESFRQIIRFLLEVNGLKGFETFDFILGFFKKNKNLLYGLFEPGQPLVGLLVFVLSKILRVTMPDVEASLLGASWLNRWLTSMFCCLLRKDFLLRVFDFVLVNDMFALSYVCFAILEQLREVFRNRSEAELVSFLMDADRVSSQLNFVKLFKRLKKFELTAPVKLAFIEEYRASLKFAASKSFDHFYFASLKRLEDSLEGWEDWSVVENHKDFDDPYFEKSQKADKTDKADRSTVKESYSEPLSAAQMKNDSLSFEGMNQDSLSDSFDGCNIDDDFNDSLYASAHWTPNRFQAQPY